NRIDTLIGALIDQLAITRKGALLGLVQAASTPDLLRSQVYAKIFGTTLGSGALTQASGQTVQSQISAIKDAATRTKTFLSTITEANYETKKAQLPASIGRFFDV